jgi:hypothetical protein
MSKERVKQLDLEWERINANIVWLKSQLREQEARLVKVDEEYDYLVSVHPSWEPAQAGARGVEELQARSDSFARFGKWPD